MQRSIIAAASLAATLLIASTAGAQSLADIKKRGVIRLGYSETSVPFAFKTKEGAPGGYSVEICARIAATIGSDSGAPLKGEWVSLNPTTRLDAVAKGTVDLECGTTTITMARREKVDFSLPIFVDSATVLARKSVASSLPQLQGKKVAVADNTTTLAAVETGLAKRFVKAEIVHTKSVADAFEMLKSGQVDAMASDRTVLVGTFLQGGGAEGLIVFSDDLSYEPYGIVMRKGDADMRLAVDRVISRLYRTGEIEAVYGTWLAPLGSPTLPLMSMYLLNGYPD